MWIWDNKIWEPALNTRNHDKIMRILFEIKICLTNLGLQARKLRKIT